MGVSHISLLSPKSVVLCPIRTQYHCVDAPSLSKHRADAVEKSSSGQAVLANSDRLAPTRDLKIFLMNYGILSHNSAIKTQHQQLDHQDGSSCSQYKYGGTVKHGDGQFAF